MSKKVFVGNLPFSIDNARLKEIFKDYGEIEEATVITNRFSGRSKGFGFVTIQDDAQADKAISEMNGKDIEGRQITVNEARPLESEGERPRKGPLRGNSSFGRRRE